jgi:hypothetical protein
MGGYWSPSSSSNLPLRKEPCIHWIGGWVDPSCHLIASHYTDRAIPVHILDQYGMYDASAMILPSSVKCNGNPVGCYGDPVSALSL